MNPNLCLNKILCNSCARDSSRGTAALTYIKATAFRSQHRHYCSLQEAFLVLLSHILALRHLDLVHILTGLVSAGLHVPSSEVSSSPDHSVLPLHAAWLRANSNQKAHQANQRMNGQVISATEIKAWNSREVRCLFLLLLRQALQGKNKIHKQFQ